MCQKGQLLLRIDPRDYEAALAQAKAQVEQALAGVENANAQILAQQANIAQAQNQRHTGAGCADVFPTAIRARAVFVRPAAPAPLAGATAGADRSDAEEGRVASVASQRDRRAEKQLVVIRAQRSSALAQVDAAKANVNTAQVNIDRTTVAAAQAGSIANLTAAVGGYAQPGQSLMSLVPETSG